MSRRTDRMSGPVGPVRERLFALYKAGRYADVLALARDRIAVEGEGADLLSIVGNALRALGDDDQALWSHRASVRAKPDYALGWSNLGLTLTLKGWLRAGQDAHRRALELDPENPILLENLAALHVQRGDDRGAIAIYDRLLSGADAPTPVHFLRAQARLRIGDFAGGWSDYEHRLDPAMRLVRPFDGRSRWLGDRRPRLLVATEQGLGDAIWGARFLAAARARVGELSVRAPKELTRLFEGVAGVDRVVRSDEDAPADAPLAMLGSLGRLFAASTDQIDGAPYLSRAPARPAGAAAMRVRKAPPGLKLGLVWAGNAEFSADRFRSTSLGAMLKAVAAPGVTLFSLQKGPAELQLQTDVRLDRIGREVIPLGPLLSDFEDTRRALAELDLVITVDTAVAHLAGAIGVPAWVLVGRNSYWVWGREPRTTLWYDSVRLFRVPAAGAWDDVLDEVAAALMEHLDGVRPSDEGPAGRSV